MSARQTAIEAAARNARRQIEEVVRDLRNARLAAGLSQGEVARALRVSRQQVTRWEGGSSARYAVQLAQFAAAVGLDVSVRTFAGGSPLRDAGQLRALSRARQAIGDGWRWRTEVPVSSNPLERRAFDALISTDDIRIGLEVITRLTDVQAQTRAALLKQEAADLDCLVLVLADSRRNRAALAQGLPTLLPSFPLGPRTVLTSLRAGRAPGANGIFLV